MFSTFKWVEPDKTVVFPYHKIHPKSEIFGHKRRETNDKKSWKTISNTLSINYINTLMTDGYMILGKIKRTIQIKQDITHNQNYIDIIVSKTA